MPRRKRKLFHSVFSFSKFFLPFSRKLCEEGPERGRFSSEISRWKILYVLIPWKLSFEKRNFRFVGGFPLPLLVQHSFSVRFRQQPTPSSSTFNSVVVVVVCIGCSSLDGNFIRTKLITRNFSFRFFRNCWCKIFSYLSAHCEGQFNSRPLARLLMLPMLRERKSLPVG